MRGYMNVASGGAVADEKGAADIPSMKCTVRTRDVSWRATDVAATVIVEFEAAGASELSVTPSLHLIALPKRTGPSQKEYWAPFALATGASTNVTQKLTPSSGEKVSVRVIPGRLLWARTVSSVWPSKSFRSAVPPGRYALQAQVEVNSARTVYSNEVAITVVK
jgi:hypothetical protein